MHWLTMVINTQYNFHEIPSIGYQDMLEGGRTEGGRTEGRAGGHRQHYIPLPNQDNNMLSV